MIAQELERSLHEVFVHARAKRHVVVTVEHLLLALLDNPSARKALVHRGADIEGLRGRLARYIGTHTTKFGKHEETDTQPNSEFQRAIQDAILRAQSSGEREVTGADVFLAISRQKKSAAARVLEGFELPDGPETDDGEDLDATPAEQVIAATLEEIQRADELQIVMLNDDRTPMEFVVALLQRFFSMDREEAKDAMLEIHQQGAAVLGLYSRQAAKDQLAQVAAHIMQHGHPLRCVLVVPK